MSTFGHDVRHGLRIARVELRRSLRASIGTRKRRLTLLGALLAFSPLFVLWFRVAHDAGRDAARLGSVPTDLLGTQLFLLVVVFVVMAAMRVVQSGRPEGDAMLLTATTPRAVFLGLTVHATLQLVSFLLFPTLLFAAAFALGAGHPSVVLTAVLALVPLFAAVALLGTVVGQLFVLGLLRSRLLRRLGRVLGVVLLLALMALSYAIAVPAISGSSRLAFLSPVAAPVVRYVSFVFAGTPFVTPPDALTVAVGLTVVTSVPVLFAVGERLAPRLWFADATSTDLLQRDRASSNSEPLGGPALEHGARSPRAFPPRTGSDPLGIALGLWIRWLRVPVRFSSLFPLAIMLATALIGVVNEPDVLPAAVGAVLVFSGVYVSGAIFGLNPLGAAGDVRLVELLSRTPSRSFVFGHVLAGLLAGTPLALAGAVVLTQSMGLAAPTSVLVAGLAAVTSAAGAGVAVGLGSTLPGRDATRTYRGYTTTTPSQWALLGYVVAVVVVVGIATVGGLGLLLPSMGGSRILLGGVIPLATAAVLLGLGYAGVRVAVGRFERPIFTS